MHLTRLLGGSALLLSVTAGAPTAFAQSSSILDPGVTALSPTILIVRIREPSDLPFAGLSAPPMFPPRPFHWLTKEDYPRRAISERRQGEQLVTLAIDTAGLVTDCHIKAASGYRPFDEIVCGLLRKRVRFIPARNGMGEPTPATTTLRIAYLLDMPPPERPRP